MSMKAIHIRIHMCDRQEQPRFRAAPARHPRRAGGTPDTRANTAGGLAGTRHWNTLENDQITHMR